MRRFGSNVGKACAESCSASSSLVGGFGPGADWEGSFMPQAERRRVRLAIPAAIQVWLPESPEGRASRIWQDGIGIDFIASVYLN